MSYTIMAGSKKVCAKHIKDDEKGKNPRETRNMLIRCVEQS